MFQNNNHDVKGLRYFKIILFLLVALIASLDTYGQTDTHVLTEERTIAEDLSSSEKSTAQLYKNVLPSVVTIFTKSNAVSTKGAKKNEGLGSGVLISSECHILTAAHVVAGSTEISVKTQDGKIRKATVLFSDQSSDIALLKLQERDTSLGHATLGNSDKLAVGQNIYAIGSPYGMENSFSSGVISAFRGFNKIYDGTVKVEFIQTDAAINSGNSGGPLFNSKGEVIGIASSILTVSGGFQGIGMAVAINTAKDLLAFENRPWIGVDGVLLQKKELSEVFNLSIDGGILIQSVSIDSPAYKAGLRPGYIPAVINGQNLVLGGDIVLSIGKQDACHVDCLDHIKSQLVNKTSISIRYLRNGKEYTALLDVSETRRNFLTNKD